MVRSYQADPNAFQMTCKAKPAGALRECQLLNFRICQSQQINLDQRSGQHTIFFGDAVTSPFVEFRSRSNRTAALYLSHNICVCRRDEATAEKFEANMHFNNQHLTPQKVRVKVTEQVKPIKRKQVRSSQYEVYTKAVG